MWGMGKASISVSLPTQMLVDIDDLVEDGVYDDRSEAIEDAVDKLLTKEW